MITFQLVDGGKATLNIQDLSNFEYKLDTSEGIKIKYPKCPELHIKKLPAQPKRKILAKFLWTCNTYEAKNEFGAPVMLNAFLEQRDYMKNSCIKETQGNIGLDFKELPIENTHERKFEIHFYLIPRLGAKQDDWMKWPDNVDESTLNSFMKDSNLTGMPVLTWFEPSTQPWNQTWKVFEGGGWLRRIA